jgi:hypothetical protein
MKNVIATYAADKTWRLGDHMEQLFESKLAKRMKKLLKKGKKADANHTGGHQEEYEGDLIDIMDEPSPAKPPVQVTAESSMVPVAKAEPHSRTSPLLQIMDEDDEIQTMSIQTQGRAFKPC